MKMNEKWTEYQLTLAGLLITALGIVVLAGWATHTRVLVQLIPASTDMRRNTAFGLMVCGIGMISLTSRRRLPAQLAGVLCTLLGLLTALEWALGLNLGIDDLLGRSYFPGESFPPGRMSPITTLCFMLAGCVLVFWRPDLGRRFRSWIAGALTSVLAAIGLVTSMGYVFGNTNAYGWGDLTRMAFNTALAFAVVGLSLLIFVWREERPAPGAAVSPSTETRGLGGARQLPEWLPLSTGIGVLTATLGVWQALLAKGVEEKPLLSETVLACGIVFALLAAFAIQRRQKRSASPESTLLTGFGLAFATLVAVGAVQYRSIQVLVGTDGWVAHTHAVLTELEATYSHLQRAESGTRGYVATGQNEYVSMQASGIRDSAEHFRSARRLTADNPLQQQNLQKLAVLVGRKTVVMQQIAALRRDQGFAPASQELRKGEGLELMNQIRAMVDVMEAEENGLLADRQTASSAGARKANVATALGTLLALTLILAAGWITRREALERERAKEALQRASAYNRNLIEASLDPLVTISPEGKITDVNEATVKVTGMPREKLIGTDFSNYFAEPEQARTGYQEVFEKGFVTDYPLTIRHQSGRLTHVVYNASVYRDADGKVLGVFAAARDITDRKQAEQALQDSKRRFDLAQKAGRLGSWEWFIDSGEVIFTPEMEAIYGLPPGGFGGKYESWRKAIYPDDIGRLEQDLRDVLDGKKDYDSEFRVLWPDGSVRWMAARGSLFYDGGARPSRMIGINVDITARKRAEEALKKYTADLARSNADLEQFAYVASHDLQEPLRMVASFTQLLAQRYRGKLGAEADDFIGYAVDGARRMQLLLNDLLAYSRVGTRGKELAPARSEETLEAALANLMKSIEETAATVTHDPLPMVMADETQLTQVFQNLVGNALKFHGSEPPRIHISAQPADGQWRFSVRDHGIGIDPKHADRIFVIFQRLHTSAEYPGTGLGLAISKKIVERHGGRIWMESEPAKGATFYFTMAKAVEKAAPSRESKVESAVEGGKASRELNLES